MNQRLPTISREGWYDAHSRCPTCNNTVTMTMLPVLAEDGQSFTDQDNTATCGTEIGCGWTGKVADCVPRALLPISHQSRKAMIATVRAANVCLALQSRDGVLKAVEALTLLCEEDLRHALVWLGGLEPVGVGIALENVDKLVALTESVLRNRPIVEERYQRAIVAAKEQKAKAQVEN
jgi:hypothetical protein